MKKILVKYRNFTFGELTFENGKFCYKADENVVKDAMLDGYPVFLYYVDKSFESETLPESLMNFVPAKNSELYTMADVQEEDSLFEILYKVAGQSLYDGELYISQN